jgi:hypothetical protein
MNKDLNDRLQKELAEWRTRLEELRVKASLGKLELRDKERELMERFEPAYKDALKRAAELKDQADDRAKAMRAGIEAGWKELRATYHAVREGQSKKP